MVAHFDNTGFPGRITRWFARPCLLRFRSLPFDRCLLQRITDSWCLHSGSRGLRVRCWDQNAFKFPPLFFSLKNKVFAVCSSYSAVFRTKPNCNQYHAHRGLAFKICHFRVENAPDRGIVFIRICRHMYMRFTPKKRNNTSRGLFQFPGFQWR